MHFLAQDGSGFIAGHAPDLTLAQVQGIYGTAISYTPRQDEVPLSVNWSANAITWGPIPTPVPQKVSRMQARIAMRRAGVLAEVEATVQAAGAQNAEILDAWDDAVEFQRDSPLIASLNALLSTPMTSAELDALFIAAAAITA